jgi:hypothetical protein
MGTLAVTKGTRMVNVRQEVSQIYVRQSLLFLLIVS